MHNDYDDIRSKLGEPDWFDEHGVPRYCDFAPRRCGVYIRYAALVEIACQACARRFQVVAAFHSWYAPHFPDVADVGSFHYGDPPNHHCVGDTMNCETIRVIEFWRRDGATELEWRRDASLELSYGS